MAPPRPEKIEQKRTRELTKVIQLSPNTAAGGFRAQTRRASFAGRPPTPRRRFWRAIAPRLNLRGGMVVRTRARQTRRRTRRLGVNPMQPAQKSETAKRTSWTARPTRMRTTTHATGRAERRHDRQPQRPEGRGTNSLPRAQRGARLSGRDAEIARPDAGGVWAQERRRAPACSRRGFFDRRGVFLIWGRWISLFRKKSP